MKTITLLILVGATMMISAFPSSANTAIRAWKGVDGKSFQALIVNWDTTTDIVSLSDDKGQAFTMKRVELSLADQAYVRQWVNNREKLDQKLKQMGGTMQFLQTTGPSKIDYYVYHPSNFKADGTAPLLILFSPSGTGYKMMLRHFEAAEKTGFTLITVDRFSNHLDRAIGKKYFAELLPYLQTLAHNPQKIFLGGSSGGALRAYWLSSQFDLPWAGIYANGGWLGRDHTMLCRTHMRVAMINGHKDRAALHYTKADTDYLVDKRQCDVALFSFEGGHQLAPTESQIEAFNWLLEKSDL